MLGEVCMEESLNSVVKKWSQLWSIMGKEANMYGRIGSI